MIIREIAKNELYKLKECLKELADHHNSVSVHFKGSYPSRPFEETLCLFEKAIKNHTSRIAVIEDDESVVGFGKIDFDGKRGKLDYLIVLPRYRHRGYGAALMEWAMKAFAESAVHSIAVKVVDGNEAIHLYEKYGFMMNAHILVKEDRL